MMMLRHRPNLLAPLLAPLVLLMFQHHLRPASAIFPCLPPSMYKMGKVGAQGQHSGERANWYPQAAQQKQYYPNYYPGYYGETSPMKMLFRPKWSMSSLFTPRKWMDWRMGALQRPAYGGYMAPTPYIQPQQPTGAAGYPQPQQPQQFAFNDQLLNLPPVYPGQPQRPSTGLNLNSSPLDLYSQQQLLNNNDAWSVPFNQQYNTRPNQQQQQYDSYTVSPGGSSYPQPTKQQYDNYGTKGGGGSSSKQQYNTTKNTLVADGGYNAYDAHLMDTARYTQRRRPSATGDFESLRLSPLESGYAYPDWYSGVSLSSPAKIGQQLYKQG